MRRGRDGVFRQAPPLVVDDDGIRGVEFSYTVVDELADVTAERILESARNAHALELEQVAGVWQLAPARRLLARRLLARHS